MFKVWGARMGDKIHYFLTRQEAIDFVQSKDKNTPWFRFARVLSYNAVSVEGKIALIGDPIIIGG